MARRLVYANLDAEADLARLVRPGSPRPALPGRVLERLAVLGTLLRVFATDDDEVLLPAEVEDDQVVDVPGLPRPRFVTGPLAAHRAAALLAWAETPEVAAWRARHGGSSPSSADLDAPLHELVWKLPPAAPEVVAAVHHRRFARELRRKLGCALPEEAEVFSAGGLPIDFPWVVKAPLSAAGRERYVHRGGVLDEKGRRTVERLLARHGSLVLEPWMERTDDFGCVAVVTAEATRVVGFHRQLVNRRGQFLDIELEAPYRGFFDLSPVEKDALSATVQAAAQALRGAGYVGPFGLDAWRYRKSDGGLGFQPLGELNARMTFGLVARALADRAGLTGGRVRIGPRGVRVPATDLRPG